MKTVKPQKLGLFTRVFENGREFYFVTTVMVFFPLSSPGRLLSEQSLWKGIGGEFTPEMPLDAAMPKPRGEVLVTGRAFVPGGAPKPACSVRVQCGPVDKTLYVVGDRFWNFSGATDPVPFTEMPLGWTHAFGGEGYAQNPIGKGLKPIRGEDGKERHPLPNVEDPRHLVKSPKDRPAPGGFGAYDFTWPQRFSKIGTYDKEWLETRYPGFAKDMDLALFSTAPENQRIEGFFRGDEAFRLENLHPERPVIEGRLPNVRARAFITHRREDGEEALRELSMRLDTVHFFPHLDRGLLLYRGMLRIEEDDADDVVHVLIAAEHHDAPREVDHYRDVLARRLDRKMGHLYVFRDSDLMPPEDPDAPPIAEQTDDVSEHVKTAGLLRQNMERKAELERAKAIAAVEAMGLDPNAYGLPDKPAKAAEPPTNLEQIPEFVMEQEKIAEQAKQDAEKKRTEAEEAGRKLCAELGVDYEALVNQHKQRGGGPPRLDAQAEMAKVRANLDEARRAGVPMPELEAMIDDPQFMARIEEMQRKLIEAYRKFAHAFPEASALEGEPAARIRAVVEAARARGESLSNCDFTGADLSGMDLSGADLRGVFLEAANLEGARLEGADLREAVLTRARLSGASFRGAKLAGANLGLATLEGADLSEADLEGTLLYRARIRGARLRGARLREVDFTEVTFEDNDLTEVQAHRLMLLRAQFVRMNCQRAQFTECAFIETNLVEADFTGARFDKSVFVTAKCDGAILRDLRGDNLRVVHESSFVGADFTGAHLARSTLRGTNFENAIFSGADLSGSDLSTCNLRGAKLDGVSAREARFIRADLGNAELASADLLQAMFQNARVAGASFRDANLFRADFARVRGSDETDFSGANVEQVRIVPRGSHAQG